MIDGAAPKRTTKATSAKATKLTPEELESALAQLDGWEVLAGALSKTLTFGSFSEAFAFLTRIALLAEKLDHHPDIQQSYRTVTLRLSSHDVGGLTGRDVRLAERIDAL